MIETRSRDCLGNYYELEVFMRCWTSLVVQTVKNLPTMQETRVQLLGQEDPLGKGMETHSSILAWKSPWTEEPGGLQSVGSQRVGHDWVTNTFMRYWSEWQRGKRKTILRHHLPLPKWSEMKKNLKWSLANIKFRKSRFFLLESWHVVADLNMTLALIFFLQILLITQQDGWFSESAHLGSQQRQAVTAEPT